MGVCPYFVHWNSPITAKF